MATDDGWTIEPNLHDRGRRGPRQPGFITGPRFLVTRRGEAEVGGIVELMLGDVYIHAIRQAAGSAGEGDLVLDLLDEAGAGIVRRHLASLDLEAPPLVTPLYVDGQGVDVLVERAARRG